jgi:hypothetical protein
MILTIEPQKKYLRNVYGSGNDRWNRKCFQKQKHFLLPVRLRLRQKFVPREN